MKHEKNTRKKKIRKACVYLKYLMPAISAVTVFVLCLVPTFRFQYDDTVREVQSIFGNAAVARSSVGVVAKTAAAQQNAATLALAGRVNVLVIALYAAAALMLISALILAVMTLCAYRFPPESSSANRVKLWLRFLIPGRAVHFIICLLPILPTLYPHILKSLYERYSAQYLADGEYKFLEITVVPTWIDPLIAAAALAIISIFFFILARDWEGMYKMDMFREFTPDYAARRGRHSAGASAGVSGNGDYDGDTDSGADTGEDDEYHFFS
ncbi:MAG: hypothetical protein MJ102_06460 [Clostridia bacterium]|nr:hypothetical protein [Clostridia bacterium]